VGWWGIEDVGLILVISDFFIVVVQNDSGKFIFNLPIVSE
jgi:hypothetical protein